jgi:hypothetical protein
MEKIKVNENSYGKYSKFQYFLWLIAGSEISILKRCPNDFNRHANIGLMILMTSIFAGLTGYIAGETFAHGKNYVAFIFAIIWSLLIFSLDRSMVNSIKKDPLENKTLWGYFWPRFILAIILSFFMSIPLDHIVFSERIEWQMKENTKNDWLKRQADLNKGFNVTGDSLSILRFEKKSTDLASELNDDCPIPEYIRFRDDANRLKSQLSTIPRLIKYRDKNGNLRSRRNQTYYKIQSEYLSSNNSARIIYDEWYSGIQNKIKSNDSLSSSIQSKFLKNKDSILNQSNQYKSDIEKMEGFDTQFVTLFLMPNFGVQFLKWLIFLALLVIEILPTYLKLKTPIGQYDWEVYKEEQITEHDVTTRLKYYVQEINEIEEYRNKKETELNKTVIDKVVIIEESLANEMLDEWEINAREQMKKDVKKAI